MSVRVHPTALLEEGVVLGDGTSVWNSVHIRHGTRIGSQCIVGVSVRQACVNRP